MERNMDSDLLRERTYPRVYEHLRDAETHYATYGPQDRVENNMQIPLTALPLDADRSLLLPVWQDMSNQREIYEMTLDMGMTPKWPTLNERLTRTQLAHAAPYAIPCPCFNLAVYGGDRACYAQLARQIYNYFLNKITEGNENPERTRFRDSLLFRLRTQNFIVMIYEPAKITDFEMYLLGGMSALSRPSHPGEHPEIALSAINEKVLTVLAIFLPSRNEGERLVIPYWCRMMPPRSGVYDPTERDEHGRVVDAKMLTVALVVPDHVHADWAGLQSSMDRVIQVEGLTGKLQCRIVEDLDIRIL
ncbi:hypothetical protein KC357_g3624 [Hortaea werneckii]|nr:hypothetical protein KC357_g3624 [Hortaea werneckii]